MTEKSIASLPDMNKSIPVAWRPASDCPAELIAPFLAAPGKGNTPEDAQ